MHDDPEPEPADELSPAEAARQRRRDRDAAARERELMRPGMGKVFKQIQDSWGEKAAATQGRARKGVRKDSTKPR